MHFPLIVQRHIHPNQLFVRQSVGTLGTESDGRIHVFEHDIDFGVMDAAPEKRKQNYPKFKIIRLARLTMLSDHTRPKS